MKHLNELLSISSSGLEKEYDAQTPSSILNNCGRIGLEIKQMLSGKNGFYAFESALLVRPLFDTKNSEVLGIENWNRPDLWINSYKIDIRNTVFFAEDIFGVQFCLRDDFVQSFDPETGEFTELARSLNEWAGWILSDYNTRTGLPLAQEWRKSYGLLEAAQRLIPIVPFVLGGEFSIGNLNKMLDSEGMNYRANIANQISDCPDGASVVIKTENKIPRST
jgi:hypothetical protein